ncbi:MAG: hypothetical protein HFE76_01095 [Firmicutes bacterium]|nr:hypothetical protein [Bacillota bacterium]
MGVLKSGEWSKPLSFLIGTGVARAMSEIKLYNVSDEYINYLRKDFPFVYSNKEESHSHKRKYGITRIFCISRNWTASHVKAAGKSII